MTRLIVLIFGMTVCATGFGWELTHPSGKFRIYKASEGRPRFLRSAEQAAFDFIQEKFETTRDDSGPQWRFHRRLSTKTHTHLRYRLYFQGVWVYGRTLDVHVHSVGFVDFATSSWKYSIDLPKRTSRTFSAVESLEADYKKRFLKDSRNGDVQVVPIIWMNEKTQKPYYAYDVRIASDFPFFQKRLIVDAQTLEKLGEIETYRYMDATHPVYHVFPEFTSDIDAANFSGSPYGLSTQTLPDTDGLSTLNDSSVLRVRREEDTTTPQLVDIDPTTDYTGEVGFNGADNSETGYNASCDSNGSTTGCPNQAFDGVNAYYHIKTFRSNLDTYMSELGVSATYSLDPIQVTVNSLSTSGVAGTSNNAFYATNIIDDNSTLRSGLFFLQPETISLTYCSSAEFFNLAREALVVVHEYQHYVTDEITGMVFSAQSNMAATLHEAYSDYFGASQISRISSSTITKVGEFAFDECRTFQRDIGTLKPYSNSTSNTSVAENFADPHTSGWSFASGLWRMRTLLGREAGDKLALRSLYFLSANPGFVEAVEAVVQADSVLNGGANAGTIRTLFYDTLNFTGSVDTSVFEDINAGVVRTGFSSCLSVPWTGGAPMGAGIILLIWLSSTIIGGRRLWRK